LNRDLLVRQEKLRRADAKTLSRKDSPGEILTGGKNVFAKLCVFVT